MINDDYNTVSKNGIKLCDFCKIPDYEITNMTFGKEANDEVLTLKDGSTTSGAMVNWGAILEEATDNKQNWKISRKDKAGYFTITNVESNQKLHGHKHTKGDKLTNGLPKTPESNSLDTLHHDLNFRVTNINQDLTCNSLKFTYFYSATIEYGARGA